MVLQSYLFTAVSCHVTQICSRAKLQLFADDALMYRTVQNSSDAQDLQTDINLFVQWIANNNLNLKLLLSSRHLPKSDYIFVINGQPLERVQSYKYLGVYIYLWMTI